MTGTDPFPPYEREPVTTYAQPRSTAAYQQSAVLTASPGQLVVMLYDGARRFLYQAAAAMREERHAEAGDRLRRAENIVDHLLCTLDMDRGADVASGLQALYVFFLRQMSEGRVERDPEKLDWVNGQLGELRESWAQISTAAHAS
jgi:flagellar secretion chaperone FliS